jgi:hypothetical protein
VRKSAELTEIKALMRMALSSIPARCAASPGLRKNNWENKFWGAYPGVPPWANLCRPYAAGLRCPAIQVLIFCLCDGTALPGLQRNISKLNLARTPARPLRREDSGHFLPRVPPGCEECASLIVR